MNLATQPCTIDIPMLTIVSPILLMTDFSCKILTTFPSLAM